MKVHFSKYHGTGNDFIMIDGRNFDMKILTNSTVAELCDRHFGIGADGLIVLMDSQATDFRMKYYNSDGYEGSMCGNGGRCIARFAHELGIFDTRCTFEASDGLHVATLNKDGMVRLKLKDVSGIARLEDGIFLDTGSPHMVLFKDNIDKVDIISEGRWIRNDKRFKEGTNVNFVEVNESGIRVRTYERGVEDETLSCGTGVTAAAIATHFDKRHNSSPIKVETIGGFLTVDFSCMGKEHYSDLYLTGPTAIVFEGEYEI